MQRKMENAYHEFKTFLSEDNHAKPKLMATVQPSPFIWEETLEKRK
jgi:hypothetical protein